MSRRSFRGRTAPSRRELLAAGGAALAGSVAGCSAILGRPSPPPVNPGETVVELQGRRIDDGTEAWSRRIGRLDDLLPVWMAGDGDALYHPTREGDLVARSAADGGERWRYTPEGSVDGSTVADGRLYVSVATDPEGPPDERELHAVEAGGTRLWKRRVNHDPPDPTVVDGEVYLRQVGDGAVSVVVLSAADGSETWRTDVGFVEKMANLDARGTYQSRIAVDGDELFVSHGTRTAGVDRETGETTFTFGDSYRISAPVVAGDTVVVGESSDSERSAVYGLARTDGSRRWTFGDGRGARCRPVGRDGTVYVGVGRDSNVAALDPSSGAIRWEGSLKERLVSSLSVVDGRAYGLVHELGRGRPDASAVAVGESGVAWRRTLDGQGSYFVNPDTVVADGVFCHTVQRARTTTDGG